MGGELNCIAAGTHVIGDIGSSTSLLINGRIEGNVVTTEKVTIGPTGSVKGNISCGNAEIEGRLEGQLSVKDVLSLRATANILGDIVTTKLHIEQGASFNGSCNMTKEGSPGQSTDALTAAFYPTGN